MLEWPFCPNCGATLQADSTGSIECLVCRFTSHLSVFADGGGTTGSTLPTSTTHSTTRPVPLWAKSDAEQAAILTELGCDMAQGYYFSRPVPFDIMKQLLDDGEALPSNTPAGLAARQE